MFTFSRMVQQRSKKNANAEVTCEWALNTYIHFYGSESPIGPIEILVLKLKLKLKQMRIISVKQVQNPNTGCSRQVLP